MQNFVSVRKMSSTSVPFLVTVSSSSDYTRWTLLGIGIGTGCKFGVFVIVPVCGWFLRFDDVDCDFGDCGDCGSPDFEPVDDIILPNFDPTSKCVAALFNLFLASLYISKSMNKWT